MRGRKRISKTKCNITHFTSFLNNITQKFKLSKRTPKRYCKLHLDSNEKKRVDIIVKIVILLYA